MAQTNSQNKAPRQEDGWNTTGGQRNDGGKLERVDPFPPTGRVTVAPVLDSTLQEPKEAMREGRWAGGREGGREGSSVEMQTEEVAD